MPRLSDQIKSAIDTSRSTQTTLGEFIETLSVKSHMFPVLILTAPFLFPIPIPFLSSTAGVLTIFLGVSIFLGIRPWIPNRVSRLPLSEKLVVSSLIALGRLTAFIERFVFPRFTYFSRHPLTYRTNGLVILVCGFIFMTPLPPFAHMPTALAVGAVAAGDLEDDGITIIIGYFLMTLNLLFLKAMIDLGIDFIKYFGDLL